MCFNWHCRLPTTPHPHPHPHARGEARHQALRGKLFTALAEEEEEWGHGSLLAWVASKGLVGNANVLAKGDFGEKARAEAFAAIS